MKNKFCNVLLASLVLTAGCATPRAVPKPSAETDLRPQLDDALGRLDLAMQENKDLRRRIALLKRYQDIEAEDFVKAEDELKGGLASDIALGDVAVRMTSRGMDISILAEKIFVTGTDTLQDAGKEFLDRLAALVQTLFPKNYIYVEGHTDNQSLAISEYKSDWDFSFARALSVQRYLTEKRGLDPLRMSASGFGQYRPWATNDTREGRRLNRRIEIVITSLKLREPAV